ncbi:unnamed protein product [Rotaria sordida]|uniref:Sulfotransferase domain-containing protein n=1 Tax=Rotaria sordida TaxID=392033 RepID=A0A818NAC6_9BILA|nr:unnamed protein product [Rotaria sordida]CAF1492847.1 unnamed protein product [Rotaria sordida]CAF3603384.1 unnamed protein product [Rotaria sordida]CAF4150017.1 unnamed protein product [Rotaria sordida]
MVEVCPEIKMIEGIPMSSACDAEIVRSALNYKARSDDIFLVVYPKSGTTWMQVILYTLMNDGEAFDNNIAEYFARTPFLELLGGRGMQNMHRPCVIKTHLPFNRVPYHENAKYICVVRNPKDVCVSYYYFLLKFIDSEPKQTLFDAFFEAFINGNVYFGDYFEHLRSVWQHKDDTNVFLTSYEEMKHDLPGVIRRVAHFMNIELSDSLLERTVTYSSFNYMKERFHKAYSTQARVALANEALDAPSPIDKTHLQMCDNCIVVREGVAGNWSSTMSEEQSQRLDKIFAEKTADMPGVHKLFLS